jgi:hypothetical protein
MSERIAMMKRCHRNYLAPILASLAIILIAAIFVSVEADVNRPMRATAPHIELKAVMQNAENQVTTTSTSTTTTTSTTTSSTTTTTTTITTTRWTRTTTTTESSLTTTTRTTGMTYTSTSLSPTLTGPTTVAIIWIYSTTTTTTTTVTQIGTTQLVATTSARTTVTITTAITPGTRQCIIASVAYASPIASEVQFLRELRDEAILRSFAGKRFMKVFDEFYYSFSPRAAEILEKDSFLQSLTRMLISLLIASLRTAATAVTLLPYNLEFTNVLFGVIASALTGTVYLSPVLILSKTASKFRSRSASTGLKREDQG